MRTVKYHIPVLDAARMVEQTEFLTLDRRIKATKLAPSRRDFRQRRQDANANGQRTRAFDRKLEYRLSKSAVKFHLLELYRKLKVSNRAEAVAIALRKHLLKI